MKKLLPALLISLFAVTAASAQVPTYTVKRATTVIVPDGLLSEQDWTAAPTFTKFTFPWGYADSTQQTTVKMLWDNTFLYLAITCMDKYMTTKTFNTVGKFTDTGDDYIQMLWNPNPSAGNRFNIFEFNAVGCPHAMYNDLTGQDFTQREYRILPPHITQSVTGTVNNDSGTDTGWTLEIAIRFSDYPELFGATAPQADDIWRVALNRVDYGGGKSVQYSQWSPSSSATSGDFLRPADFGRIIFSSTSVR